MPTIRTATTAALAALTLSLAACGGDDGGSGDGTLSKGDLQSKANAVCKDVETRLKAVTQPSDIQDANVASAYFDKVAPLATDLVDRLKALKPGDAEKADYDAFTAASTKVSDLLGTLKDKAKAKDQSGLQDLAKLDPLGSEANAAAKKLGLDACAD
ncbi:hypothetical protein [Patulibacter minatonensis]|uniref:hypothetical protein n=1 Tax=Patulibacter minatonensis TaxID=298163 RepID=UPI0012F7A4B7|nr:hypothetical protein [Patulibacter minatonensis]